MLMNAFASQAQQGTSTDCEETHRQLRKTDGDARFHVSTAVVGPDALGADLPSATPRNNSLEGVSARAGLADNDLSSYTHSVLDRLRKPHESGIAQLSSCGGEGFDGNVGLGSRGGSGGALEAIRAMAYEHMVNQRKEGNGGAGVGPSIKLPNGLLASTDVLRAVGDADREASAEKEGAKELLRRGDVDPRIHGSVSKDPSKTAANGPLHADVAEASNQGRKAAAHVDAEAPSAIGDGQVDAYARPQQDEEMADANDMAEDGLGESEPQGNGETGERRADAMAGVGEPAPSSFRDRPGVQGEDSMQEDAGIPSEGKNQASDKQAVDHSRAVEGGGKVSDEQAGAHRESHQAGGSFSQRVGAEPAGGKSNDLGGSDDNPQAERKENELQNHMPRLQQQLRMAGPQALQQLQQIKRLRQQQMLQLQQEKQQEEQHMAAMELAQKPLDAGISETQKASQQQQQQQEQELRQEHEQQQQQEQPAPASASLLLQQQQHLLQARQQQQAAASGKQARLPPRSMSLQQQQLHLQLQQQQQQLQQQQLSAGQQLSTKAASGASPSISQVSAVSR